MKVITLSNAKGGIGKSSISFNLAHRTAKKNKVLFIDLDSQCNSSSMFERTHYNMYDVLTDEVHIEDAISHSDSQKMDYLAVLR